MVRYLGILIALASCVASIAASPIASAQYGTAGLRAALLPRDSADDFENGNTCKPAYLVFAKGSLSLESGNLGGNFGPYLCTALKDEYKDKLGCQGLNKYTASFTDFFNAKGSSEAAIADARDTLTRIHFRCPNATIVAAGWSQGAAVMRWAVGELPSVVKQKVAGVALVGDAMNVVLRDRIEGYPVEKVHVFCAKGDSVCRAAPIPPSMQHWLYAWNGELEKATGWLMGKLGPLGPHSTAELPSS